MSDLPVRVSPAVRDAVVAESVAREVSINDVVVGVIAAHYGFAFEGTGRRSPGTRGGKTIPPLRLPAGLYRLIDMDTVMDRDGVKRTKLEIVERILCDHYGLPYPQRNGRGPED